MVNCSFNTSKSLLLTQTTALNVVKTASMKATTFALPLKADLGDAAESVRIVL